MRLSFRFIFPLGITLALIAWALVPFAEGFSRRWFVRDLDIRAELVFHTLEESVPGLLEPVQKNKISAIFNRLIKDERLFAVAICDSKSEFIYRTATYPKGLECQSPSPNAREIVNLQSGLLHVYRRDLIINQRAVGHLVIAHDMSFVIRRSDETRTYIFYLFVGLGAIISLLTVTIAQLSWRGWVSGLRALLNGDGLLRPMTSFRTTPELRPIAQDLRVLVKELRAERSLRESAEGWSPQTIREILRRSFSGEEIIAVSNREPYIHEMRNGNIETLVPASGLVTALEPIMRACSGVWIAHGSGSADKLTVDRKDHVYVPPEDPAYRIRRLWLEEKEEQGYYYGFANEGLWPLCHMAHTRPIFRASDWEQYEAVNRKFAKAVVEEAKTSDPVVLVQDYHLALVPKMIREKLPRATIITFWHIPWPNPESFGICPWREEILRGLLGSSIVGFHTRFHCSNFLDSVDRLLEARVEKETSTVSSGGKTTAVNHYPISIEWPNESSHQVNSPEARAELLKSVGLDPHLRIGIGVDRLDYTKGILERFSAIERMLELYPEWIGHLTFIQIAAPSRSKLKHYQDFESEVRTLAAKINSKYSQASYQPIVLKVEHHEPHQIYEYYRLADFCFVTSLHDGMNLVAKEFVASREDKKGVLILSQFAGASKELTEALTINPYDIDQCAEAVHLALTMPEAEQEERMKSMRALVKEFNIFRWAGKMLLDGARMRHHRRFTERLPFAKTDIDRRYGA